MAQKVLIDPAPIETLAHRARLARDAPDLHRAQALRARLFRGATATPDARPDATPDASPDRDRYDDICRHVLVEDRATGALVATCRLLDLADGRAVAESYAARHYGLDRLGAYRGRMLELGRLCIAADPVTPAPVTPASVTPGPITPGPVTQDPVTPGPVTPGPIIPGPRTRTPRNAEVLRLAWGLVAKIVETDRVGMLFGCTSFRGTDETPYLDAFALLKERHMGPAKWRPAVKAPDVYRYAGTLSRKPDVKRALKTLPPLLRSYLAMGGWVSDHAVRDHDLQTLHVFTGLEVDRVPISRRRFLGGP